MWEYVILVWATLGAGYWIIKPLLGENGDSRGWALDPDSALERLNAKKEGAYAAIRELEFDLNMGKLSEEDFQVLKQQYLQEAAGYMKEIDELKTHQTENSIFSGPDIERKIEPEAAPARMRKSTSEKDLYCSVCGQKASFEDNFCGGCGKSLK